MNLLDSIEKCLANEIITSYESELTDRSTFQKAMTYARVSIYFILLLLSPAELAYLIKNFIKMCSSIEKERYLSLDEKIQLYEKFMQLYEISKITSRRVVKKGFVFKNNEQKLQSIYESIGSESLNQYSLKNHKRGKSNQNKSNYQNGRIVRYSNKVNGRIAILPTIINSALKMAEKTTSKTLTINTIDYLYPEYEYKQSYNIMLIADISSSVSDSIPFVKKFVEMITYNSSRMRDKLGLITFQDNLPRLAHHPTLNVKQVIGTLENTSVKGLSPLAEGIKLALSVFKRTQYQKKNQKNMILLISDCYPEPLEKNIRNIMEQPAYLESVLLARKIRENNISLMILNPSRRGEVNCDWGYQLARKMIETSEGKYFHLFSIFDFKSEKASLLKSQKDIMTNFMKSFIEIKKNKSN
ncbi:MAG: VWA domain-containing protein [Candidatus Cloacimonetes bacterium]|nr:VWA domain-containing protein [Candidatus Cloacimonadota bacterium]